MHRRSCSSTRRSRCAPLPGRAGATRLVRAKRLALRLQQALSDVPIGHRLDDRPLAPESHADDRRTLFERTVLQSIAVNQPPPSQEYQTGRATTFDALVPLVESHFCSPRAFSAGCSSFSPTASRHGSPPCSG